MSRKKEQGRPLIEVLAEPDSVIGVDTWGVPQQAPEDLVTLTAVLVLGGANDVACYVGIGTPEWVSLRGDKVGFHEAELHFPALGHEMEKHGWTYRGPQSPFRRTTP